MELFQCSILCQARSPDLFIFSEEEIHVVQGFSKSVNKQMCLHNNKKNVVHVLINLGSHDISLK